jgi:hypothetical protein
MRTAHYVIIRHPQYTPYTKDSRSFHFWRLCEDFYGIENWDDAIEVLPECFNDVLHESKSQFLIDTLLDCYSKAATFYAHFFKYEDSCYEFYLMLDENREIVLLFFRKASSM